MLEYKDTCTCRLNHSEIIQDDKIHAGAVQRSTASLRTCFTRRFTIPIQIGMDPITYDPVFVLGCDLCTTMKYGFDTRYIHIQSQKS